MSDADKKERSERLHEFEDKLQGEKRGNLETISDHVVEMSRAIRLMLTTEIVTTSKLEFWCNSRHNKNAFGWPKAVAYVMSIVVACGTVAGLIVRLSP